MLRFVTFVAAVLAVLSMGGCTESSVTVAEPLSAQEFQRQGNLICSELATRLGDIVNDETDDAGLLTASAYDQMNQARATSYAALFTLRPPTGSQADLVQLEEIREELVAAASARVPEPDVALRLGPQWEAVALRLNLTDCV